MKITIASTTKIVTMNNIQCRVWEGKTEGGVEVHAFIPRIAAREGQDLSQFERELEEQLAPSEAVAAIPLRLIL